MLNRIYSRAEEKTNQYVTWIQVLYKAAPAKECWSYHRQFCHQMTQFTNIGANVTRYQL
uniref:Uncharacterized protein n=1 Tax=Arundo donax TaxID=35708 RepID=A0A0A9GI48_ARUDO